MPTPKAEPNVFLAEHFARRGFAVPDFRTLLFFALAYSAAYGYGSLFVQTNATPLWLPTAGPMD